MSDSNVIRCLCGCGAPRRPSPRNRWDRGIIKGQVPKWVPGHERRGVGGCDPRVRIWGLIELSPNGCWLWNRKTIKGYGQIRVGRNRMPAHRWAYEAFVGPIPHGLTLDHACHSQMPQCKGGDECLHRRCVNPWHMAPMSSAENTFASINAPATVNARKTHCVNGHPFTPENTYFARSGRSRKCKTCSQVRQRLNKDHVNALARERWARKRTARI